MPQVYCLGWSEVATAVFNALMNCDQSCKQRSPTNPDFDTLVLFGGLTGGTRAVLAVLECIITKG